MTKHYILLLVMFFSASSFSQELFGVIGRNITKYDYKNSNGESIPNLEGDNGSFFEAGVAYPISDSEKLFYKVSLTLNNFNATADITGSSYSWKTGYLGIQNALAYNIYSYYTSFGINIVGGFNTSHIIYGTQNNNGVSYDLTSEDEFKGVFIQPFIGLEFKYHIGKYVLVKCGYNYSKAFNTSSNSEKLAFSNHQIQLGLHFEPKH